MINPELIGTKSFWIALAEIGLGAGIYVLRPELRDAGMALVAVGLTTLGLRDAIKKTEKYG